MKRLVTVVVLSALVVVLAGGPAHAFALRDDADLDFLDLSEEQRAEIEGLSEEYRATLEDLREEFFATREEHRDQLESILTEEQLEALREEFPCYDEDRGFRRWRLRRRAFRWWLRNR
ncbi:MAG: hypothetical protein ACLFS8_00095 [Clostridia bacterium]